MKNALLIGSSSEIGSAIIREICDSSTNLFVVGTQMPDLTDYETKIKFIFKDWSNLYSTIFDSSLNYQFDYVVISLGYLPTIESQLEKTELVNSFAANFYWPLNIVNELLKNDFVKRSATVIIIGSALAGLEPSNKTFVYSLFKTDLEKTLRKYFFNSVPFKVIFLKPGYVPTKLNAHLAPGRFPSSPEEIAQKLMKYLKNKRQFQIVYVPFYLKLAHFLLTSLPVFISRNILQVIQRRG